METDVLWAALAISAIVVFVFYILASYWQRLLRQQSFTIRRLSERVQYLEEMGDPEFRRRLGEATPLPLEQVFTFSFRLDDRFWREGVHASEEDQKFIHEYGSFVGSVKLERWRSHTVVTITEVLPDRKTTGWQTRTLNFYSDPAKATDAVTLWELALSRPGVSAEKPPSLDLVLRANAMELRGHLAPSGVRAGNGRHTARNRDDVAFFRVPLDRAQLAEFRSQDPLTKEANGAENEREEGAVAPSAPVSWQAFYSDCDEDLGIEWQLRLCDLTQKSEWERWGILEPNDLPISARYR